jgi:L-alanine-DL-glutamate epimerase-like enolase superfamily enzyme
VIIERIDTQVVELPLPRVVINAAKVSTESLGCVIVRLQAGAQGESFVYTMRNRHTAPVKAMIDSLGELLIGEDGACPERIWQRLWREIYFFGFSGVSVLAISALDTAIWDAQAKVLEQPLGRLLGQYTDAIPAYASQGLWTNSTPDELAAEAAALKADGWHAMKMRLGRPRLDDDVACVRAVREAVGDDVVLMADASRAFTVDHAIRLGRRLEELNLAWIEEPLPAHDHAGIAKVAAALDTPVVIGENDYTRYGFRRILEAGAADMWMLDLARVGGISEMRRVAALAAAYDIPVSNHVYAEHSLALLSTLSNCNYVEYIDWFEPIFADHVELVDGKLAVPTRPGLGYALDWAAIERLAA